MAQVDSENSTAMPAGGAGAVIPNGLVKQQRTRERALKKVARLREKASDEIDRLLAFLDASDPYVAELEDAVDDNPCDDLELEPSLCGVTVAARGFPGDPCGDDTEGDAREDDEDGHDREGDELQHGGDEHDGREPEDDGGDGAKEDDEPTLGWTVDGVISNTSADGDGAELHGSAPRDIVEAKLRLRLSCTELRWPDGTPVTAESLRTRPSNVINLDSAVL